jgi:UrcA family protein
MLNLNTAHLLGRAAVAGLLGLCATGALAASDPEFVVSQRPSGDTRGVEVRVADLNLNDTHAQRTLAIRVERAAREVCDMYAGSELDKMASARACLAEARDGALAQLEARGLPAEARRTAAGGMR